METLLLTLVLFAIHLAVVFSLVLVFAGATSLAAVAGVGGRKVLERGDEPDSPRTLPRLLGFVGVTGAILTTFALVIPLFFGEYLVGPYLDGLRERGGPDVTLDDASLNITGGKMRSDGLRLRQDDGAYVYDVEVDTVSARLSPIAALGSKPRIDMLEVTGARGWLAAGDGEDAVASTRDESRPFVLDELVIEDVHIVWRPEPDTEAVGSLKIEAWKTVDIDHEYTLLDLLGRTNATGEFLDGALTFEHSGREQDHTSGWQLEGMSLPKAGAAIGGPMKLVRDGTLTLEGRATWNEALEQPARFEFDAAVADVNFGPSPDDDSLSGQLLGALGDNIAKSLPDGARSFSFSFAFDLAPETLQNARSLYEYDVWRELENELKRAIIEEIGL